jgi:hypothetical protein
MRWSLFILGATSGMAFGFVLKAIRDDFFMLAILFAIMTSVLVVALLHILQHLSSKSVARKLSDIDERSDYITDEANFPEPDPDAPEDRGTQDNLLSHDQLFGHLRYREPKTLSSEGFGNKGRVLPFRRKTCDDART